MNTAETRPNIFDFTDYREYLSAFFRTKKQTHSDYSYAVFAERAGLKSRSYPRLVMTAKRNLTADLLPKFIKGLELSREEEEAFVALVNFCQASNLDSRRHWWERFLSLRPKNKYSQRVCDEYTFLARMAYPVLLILLRQPHAVHDVKGLSHLTGLAPHEVEEGIKSLQNLGAVKKIGENFVVSPLSFETANDIPNIAIQTFHQNMLKRASESLSLPVQDREFRSILVPINAEELSYLKKRLRDICAEVDQMFSGIRPKSDRVYALNLNLIPMTSHFIREDASQKQEDVSDKENVS